MSKNVRDISEFKEKQIRRIWDEKKEIWLFSVIDIIRILTESSIPKRYWADLKVKLEKEGSEVYEKIVRLKMKAPDGKQRFTDVVDTETLLRLIQSIPSPKAEPLKIWLAKVGYERIEEIDNPELIFNRALKTYFQKGFSEDWINKRLRSIEIRKELTDEWRERGVENKIEFAILTNEITRAWSDLSIKGFKQIKKLKKENLRDNMTNLELILNMLAETSTTEISKSKKPNNFEENKKIARKGGNVAKIARLELEKETGKNIIAKQT